MPSRDFSILIVGAGPSGLLLALLLAKQGIKVTLLEKSDEIDKQPRASFYSYPARYEFERAGIMDDVNANAFHASGISWRQIDGTYICGIHNEQLGEQARQVSLPLDQLLPLIKEHVDKQPSAQLLLSHEVTSIGQNDRKAWVKAQTPAGEKTFFATYIIGCDGGNSKIRRELFGTNFPGRTWDKQIVATNVFYPRLKEFGWKTSTNFMIDPKHFPMIAQISNDCLLRVTYGEEEGFTREQMLARQPEKYKAFLPGAPDPSEYNMVSFSPYRIHQRCAEKLRKGRFVLAADAAHLTNPFGGMGLTGGFADIGGLYDCLYGIYSGQADDSILNKYDAIRREKYWSVVDPIASGNIRRLWDPSPEAIEADSFFKLVMSAEAEKSSLDEALDVNSVMHDFTQYYKSPRAKV